MWGGGGGKKNGARKMNILLPSPSLKLIRTDALPYTCFWSFRVDLLLLLLRPSRCVPSLAAFVNSRWAETAVVGRGGGSCMHARILLFLFTVAVFQLFFWGGGSRGCSPFPSRKEEEAGFFRLVAQPAVKLVYGTSYFLANLLLSSVCGRGGEIHCIGGAKRCFLRRLGSSFRSAFYCLHFAQAMIAIGPF